MAKDLKLEVFLDVIDKATGPLKKINRASGKTAAALKETSDKLKGLKQAQSDLDSFRKLKRASQANANALEEQQREVRDLTRAIEQAEGPTKQLTRQRKAAIRRAQELKEKTSAQNQELEELRRKMKSAGRGSESLGEWQNRLAGDIKQTNTQLDRQQEKLRQIARRQRLTRDAAGRYHAGMQRAGAMQGAGMSAIGAGIATAVPLAASIYVGSEFQAAQRDMAITGNFTDQQEQALGMNARASARRWNTTIVDINRGLNVLVANGVDNVKALKKYGDILAQTATATQADTVDLAGLIYSLKTNLKIKPSQTRETLDALAFSGKQGTFELPDMAKWMPQIGPFMASLGMTGKAGAVQAASALQVARLGAGSNDEAANNFVNYLSKITAPVTAKNFADVGIDLQARLIELQKQGINPLMGSLKIIREYLGRKSPEALEQFNKALKIKDADKRRTAITGISQAFDLGKLFQDRQAMSFIRIALANMDKLRELQKSSMNATGVINKDWQRRFEIGKQQMKDFLISLRDLGITIGTLLMPLLIDVMNGIENVINAFNDWAQANPKLSKALFTVAVAVSAALIGIGALLLVASSILMPLAIFRFALKWAAIRSGALGTVLRGLGKGMLWLGKGALWLGGTAIKGLGKTLAWLAKTALPLVLGALRGISIFLLTNPIGIAISLIAAAAYLIYRNWDKIGAFFKDRWRDVKAAFDDGALAVLKLLLNWNPIGLLYKVIVAGLKALGVDIPAKFATLGGLIVDGLIAGLITAAKGLWAVTTNLFNSFVDWVKSLLGIASPSKVFASIGGFIIDGLLNGIAALPAALKEAILAGLNTLITTLPEQFANLGGRIVDGLIGGLTAKLGELKDTVVGLGSSVSGWFADKLGINSPSRVFIDYGKNTVEGYRLGVVRQQQAAINDINAFARRVRQTGAGITLAAATSAAAAMPQMPVTHTAEPVQFDRRPPIAQRAAAGDVHVGGVSIEVNAAPGMDERALAQYVAAEVQRALAQAGHDAAAARRSALYDTD